ncbi:MAG: S49 family peptidase [Methyloligellaceae bacterium]
MTEQMTAKNKKKTPKPGILKPWTWGTKTPIVPVIRLTGAIGVSSPLRPGLSLSATAGVIQKAFSVSGAKAVAIQINSPGGSPVQSNLIYTRIRALAEEKELPVYVFCEDVAASGGYMLSIAGDEIYADRSSIIGSIGVIAAGFGFDKLIEKYGIERRVYTAGRNKMSLDAFQPQKQEDVDRLLKIQADVHESFINMVKDRRGDKIKAPDDTVYTGEFWSGTQALEMGLIDGISDLRTKMREVFGEHVKLKVISQSKGLFGRMKFGSKLDGSNFDLSSLAGMGLADELISALETRAMWSRYGF